MVNDIGIIKDVHCSNVLKFPSNHKALLAKVEILRRSKVRNWIKNANKNKNSILPLPSCQIDTLKQNLELKLKAWKLEDEEETQIAYNKLENVVQELECVLRQEGNETETDMFYQKLRKS